MRFRGIIVLALMLALAGLPASAPAAQSQCGWSWVGAAGSGCTLSFRGFPITVSGTANGTVAAVVVWLQLDAAQAAPWPVILACSDASVVHASCGSSVGPDADMPDLPIGARLICNVAGVDGGTFRCSSGPSDSD